MKKVIKKSLCALLALAMVCTGLVLPGTEARAATNVEYLDWDENSKTLVKKTTGAEVNVTEITSGTSTTWDEGWYIVKGSVTFNERISISSGDVYLILADNCTLTASQGIGLSTYKSDSLTIYGQSNQSGKLIAKGADGNPAIGSNNDGTDLINAKLTINGGIIEATTTGTGAGIGAGYGTNFGYLTINGGTITAKAGVNNGSSDYDSPGGAGIGSAAYDNRGLCSGVTINGGTVTATGGPGGAGIGGGYEQYARDITINDGTITAIGGAGRLSALIKKAEAAGGAGIGSGAGCGNGGTVTINGGNIRAIGGCHESYGIRASGIGNKWAESQTGPWMTLKINGGIIYTTSVDENAKGNQGSWSGVVFDGAAGKVYGSPNITGNIDLAVPSEVRSTGISKYTLDVPGGSTLTVGEGGSITIPSGGTLNVGTKENPDAKLVVNGSVSNSGTVEVYGDVEGSISGTVKYHYRISPTAPTFTNVEYGYTQPDAKEITIKNTGLDSVTITEVKFH